MKKIIYLFWLICIISFSNYNAQTASTVCVNSTTLSAGSYSNLQTFNSISWFTLIPNVSSNEIHLTNVEFNPLFKIKKIEIYDGPCSNATLIASDSLTESTDSTLIVSITGIDISHNYSIKLYRELTTSEPSNFKMNILAPEYCGFSWSLSPPNFISYNPLTYVYTYDYNDACLVHNTTGVPINTALWSNSHNCVANITSGCSNNSSNGGIIYISYSNVAAGNPGTWLQMNVPIAIIPNVAGATYTTLIASSGSLALSLNVTGATSYTIVAINGCDFSSINPNTTFQDIESCSCNHLVVNVTPFNCNINVPNPLCANQPFCIGTFTPALNVGNYTLEGQTYVFQAQPIGGGTSINATVGTYSNNNVCFNSGLPQGNYNLVFNQTLVYFYDGTSGPLNYTCSCTNTVPVSVFNMPTGPTSISASPSTICDGETTTLTANTNGATNYIWQPGNINSPTLVVTPSVSTAYTVQSFAGTCPGPTAQITIELLNCCKFPKNFGVNFTNVTIQPSNYGGTSIPWSSIVPGGTYNNISITAPPSGNITSNIAVTGSLTINANNLSFNNCNFLFSEAAVVIQNANNTTFNKSYLRACIKNWRGIQTNGSLTIKNSVIEDAQYAVNLTSTSSNHPPLNIENTIFNLNLFGIYSTNKNLPNLNIRGCIFTSRVINPSLYVFSGAPWQYSSGLTTANLSTYPTALLKGSTVLGVSNLIKGFTGIYLFNTAKPSPNQYVTIGDATNGNAANQANYRNVYDVLQYGIYSFNSNFSSINSMYQNINASQGTSSQSSGIYQERGKMLVGSSSTGPNASLFTNTFVASDYGVKATKNATFAIANNKFSNIAYYATHIYNLYSSATIAPYNTITNNNFNTCFVDFFAFDNVKCNIDFSNNTSVYPIITGTKFRTPVMAQLNELAKPATALYNISFNNEVGKLYGVIAQNVQNATIQNNNINGQPHPTGGFNAAVFLQNTDNSQILNNVINHSPNANSSFSNYGILTDICVNNTYCENTITGSGTCMKWQGTSPSIIKRNSLNEDPTNPCQFGIWLDNNGFVGDINTVNTVTVCNDNRFGDFSFADTHTQNSSTGSRIDYDGFASPSNPYFPSTNTAYDVSLPLNPILNSYSGFVNCGPVFFNFKLSKGVPPFVAGAVVYPTNNANSNHIAKKSVYELFKKESFNTNSISNYTSFMAGQAVANSGTFYNVDSLVHLYSSSGNTLQLQQAKTQNLAITPSNTIDANQQTFNTIYFDYLGNNTNISNAQKSSLQTLAQLCPFTDGTSVYQARALLRYYNDSTYYSNACEYNAPITSSGSRLLNTVVTTNENVELSTMVFPNPANTELTITTELKDATIIITNIIGQLVLKTELTSTTKLNVSQLKNGAYLYNICDSKQKIIKTGKVIINH